MLTIAMLSSILICMIVMVKLMIDVSKDNDDLKRRVANFERAKTVQILELDGNFKKYKSDINSLVKRMEQYEDKLEKSRMALIHYEIKHKTMPVVIIPENQKPYKLR